LTKKHVYPLVLSIAVNSRQRRLRRSAIIIAGGFSKRFGQDKCLVTLAGKPLFIHVTDRISALVNETVVVVRSEEQEETYTYLTGSKMRLATDKCKNQSPLVGALAGFEAASNEYSALLPCDTPFVSTGVIQLMFELCVGKDAVIPRWPDGNLEPLQAVYNTSAARTAALKAIEAGKLDMRSMIAHLKGVRYLSTLVVGQLDPECLTFFNINTHLDLKKAEQLLKSKRHRKLGTVST
jgi:molybdopterin-guanine dinucleotide biosynthesis protein A